MARVRLYLEQSLRTQEQVAVEPGGAEIRVPFLRVFANLLIGDTSRYVRDAVVDTAAPLTVIPREHWERFMADIEWLLPHPASQGTWLTRIFGRTGGAVVSRLGRVRVTVFDMERPPNSAAPVRVLAQFEEDYSSDDRIIVGLHTSILQGRRMLVDPERREGWLEDRPT
jgi:hypothetical protein